MGIQNSTKKTQQHKNVTQATKAHQTKDEIYWKVLKAAMALDFKRGHCRWTIAELSRASGVSRPLIYYYFGKSREDILLASVKVLGEECFGLSDRRITLWKNGDFKKSVKESRKFIQEHQDLAAFYFAQRAKPHFVGEALRELERKYEQKLKAFFKNASESEIHTKIALLFGCVFAPSISETALDSLRA